ncbi:hypothetical protein BU24DRAFT_365915 [Aaosphaeria arxii CBS 175.79]|uniref:FAR-17a/AIG1-like protein n=1 Tax=Aaosphaeria arxii CBS 175.79 TaxID=1450172 RepID=A0A6A5Y5N4_9PLEO|nr:uncharacterized protein BU24DRAFT_365915 [Aaosphaeria arxii CBS 175.79]KAF2020090.1 hypothetical protein BU24DRAFT_365915 [Aaosphaeria arxii CBS 175.79]
MPCWKRSSTPRESPFDVVVRFETSWLFEPAVLLAVRALLSLYAFATIFFIWGWNGTHGHAGEIARSFSYFTWLTYWGLAFYNLVSAIHTFSYWRTGTPLLARWPRFLQIAHSMFYTTIVVFPWIVTIVYWALLYEDGIFTSTFQTWTNTSQHAMNSAYALFEIVFPRTAPLPWIDLIPVIIILACYLGLAYVTEATQGFYVYGFLNLKKNSAGSVAGYIVGILVAAVIVFLIVRYLIVLRVWVTEKKLGKLGKFSTRGQPQYGAVDGGKHVPMHSIVSK